MCPRLLHFVIAQGDNALFKSKLNLLQLRKKIKLENNTNDISTTTQNLWFELFEFTARRHSSITSPD